MACVALALEDLHLLVEQDLWTRLWSLSGFFEICAFSERIDSALTRDSSLTLYLLLVLLRFLFLDSDACFELGLFGLFVLLRLSRSFVMVTIFHYNLYMIEEIYNKIAIYRLFLLTRLMRSAISNFHKNLFTYSKKE